MHVVIVVYLFGHFVPNKCLLGLLSPRHSGGDEPLTYKKNPFSGFLQ